MDVRRVRVDKRWVNTTARIALSFGLLYSIYLVSTRAVALSYFRQGSPEGVRKAVQWDPRNSEYYIRRARLMQYGLEEGNTGEAIRLYEKTVQLSPHNADYWAELAKAYEWVGRLGDAQKAYERAQFLFPNSPDITWELGNFYLRTGKTHQAFQAFQKAMLGDPSMRRRAFDLAWRATGDGKVVLTEMIPPQEDIRIDYLDYLTETKRMEEAAQVWGKLLELGLRLDPKAAFPYLDALIQHRRVDQLTAAWEKVLEPNTAQIRRRSSGQNLVTNSDFQDEILNGGLDWRVTPTEGVVVSVDAVAPVPGAHSLRVQFDGKKNIDYHQLYQYVPVKPNTAYYFAGYMRARGITTDSGPRFQLLDAYDQAKLFLETDNLVGTADWVPQQLQFKTGPETQLLVIRVARPLSRKFDNRIGGIAWVGHFALHAVE